MHFQLGKSLSTFCIPAVPTQELKIKREDEKLFEEAFLDTQILVSVANQKQNIICRAYVAQRSTTCEDILDKINWVFATSLNFKKSLKRRNMYLKYVITLRLSG